LHRYRCFDYVSGNKVHRCIFFLNRLLRHVAKSVYRRSSDQEWLVTIILYTTCYGCTETRLGANPLHARRPRQGAGRARVFVLCAGSTRIYNTLDTPLTDMYIYIYIYTYTYGRLDDRRPDLRRANATAHAHIIVMLARVCIINTIVHYIMVSRCINGVLVHVVSHRKRRCAGRMRASGGGNQVAGSRCLSACLSHGPATVDGDHVCVVSVLIPPPSCPRHPPAGKLYSSSLPSRVPYGVLQRYRSCAIWILCMFIVFFGRYSARSLADLRYAYKPVNNIIVYRAYTSWRRPDHRIFGGHQPSARFITAATVISGPLVSFPDGQTDARAYNITLCRIFREFDGVRFATATLQKRWRC